MITKYLTMLGDKLGLVRDNLLPDQTDGLTHLYIGVVAHLVVSVIIIFSLPSYLFIANLITLIITTAVFAYGEHLQEKAMCKEDPERVYSISKNRIQDVAIYAAVFGIILAGAYLWIR